ncbi:MAG: O-antigen ligase family protein [Acidobacteriia bacterium]|nr:O-antigen ligase family protein [Terriglobia bacterium]
MFWATTSLAWTPALVEGMQNILVMGAFVLLLLVGEATASTTPEFALWTSRCLDAGVFLAVAIYGTSVLIWGPGTNILISARSFGLFAVYGVANQLAKWRHGRKQGLLWAVLITVLIGVSESRLALGVAVCLFPISQIPVRGWIQWAKAAVVAVSVAALSYAAFNYFDALRDRFLKGDVSLRIWDVSINASGRTAFWRATLDSWRESPLVGKGAGSSENLIESVFVTISHPHNDYLRILHDYGFAGTVIWAAGILTLLVSLWHAWRHASQVFHAVPQLYLAGFLMLIAFVLSMTAENPIVDIFATAPVGLVVGCALGLQRSLARSRVRFKGSPIRQSPNPSIRWAR